MTSSRGQFGVMFTLAYDGRLFSGWQRQPNARTIAGELEEAVRTVDERASGARGVSRTDAGVHARGQIVAFTTHRDIDSRGWTLAVNMALPDEISVVRAARVPPNYDPRPYALWKKYRYRVLNAPVRDPFYEGRSWRIREELDLHAMRREASALVGTHDFAAFRSAKDARETTVRTLTDVHVEQNVVAEARFVDITVTGDRFLYNMVRIIAGALVDVGRGRIPPGATERALRSLERDDLGMTAPAAGLYLEHIELEGSGTDPWPPDG